MRGFGERRGAHRNDDRDCGDATVGVAGLARRPVYGSNSYVRGLSGGSDSDPFRAAALRGSEGGAAFEIARVLENSAHTGL